MKRGIPATIACLFLVLACSGAVTLSGTVSDSASAMAISGVSVGVFGLSVPTFAESTITDADGKYQFDGVSALATFRMTFRLNGYKSRTDSIVIGSTNKTYNVFLAYLSLPSEGTIHSKTASGTWLPSGNPHFIIDTVVVNDSLYIAPGCSVLFWMSTPPKCALKVNGNLAIGSLGSERCHFEYVHPQQSYQESDFSGSIILSNPFSSFDIANAYVALNGLLVRCSQMRLDSVSLYLNSGCTIAASDDIIIKRSCDIITGSGSIHDSISAENIRISDSFLSLNHQTTISSGSLLIDNCKCILRAGTINPESSLVIRHTQIFPGWNGFCSGVRCGSIPSEIQINPARVSILDHNNLFYLTLGKGWTSSDTISNNIIKLNQFAHDSLIFLSPFRNNLFAPTFSDPPSRILGIFGLLTYSQGNVNGDSCDIWFNMLGDPMFADSMSGLLYDNSPAIGAASDGTNIGYYQGNGITNAAFEPKVHKAVGSAFAIRSLPGRRIIISTPSNGIYEVSIYDVCGRILYHTKLTGTGGTLSLPSLWSPGTRLAKITSNSSSWSGKFVLRN
jgi:hypothetical protein